MVADRSTSCTKGDSATRPGQRKLPASSNVVADRSTSLTRGDCYGHNLTNGSSPLHRMWWPIVLLLARKEILRHTTCTNGSFLLSSNVVADRSTSLHERRFCGTSLTNGSFLLHRMWPLAIVLLLSRKEMLRHNLTQSEASRFIEYGGRSSYFHARKEILHPHLTNGSFLLHRMSSPIVLLLCTKGDAAARPDQRKLPASPHRIWWPIVLLLARKEILQHEPGQRKLPASSNVVADRSTSLTKGDATARPDQRKLPASSE
jgi:hypothetical protein